MSEFGQDDQGPGEPDARSASDRLYRLAMARPVLAACLFESMFAMLAIALALVFGLRPWAGLEVSFHTMAVSAIATVPMLIGLALLGRAPWAWAGEIREFIRTTLLPLFHKTGWIGLALVALAAGVGEELLFRGVIQAGLDDLLGPAAALIMASLMFGLAHAVTRAYFVLSALVGAYLGLLYIWTGNLLVAIAVHALYDWIALVWYLRRYREST